MCSGSFSPKGLLMIISGITFLVGGVLCGFGGYLAYSADVNTSAMALAVLGGCILVLSFFGYFGGKTERNWMLLVYFYVNVFLIVCLVLFAVSAIFFQESLKSWIKHNWGNPTLEYLRTQSCCQTYEDTVHFLGNRFEIVGIIGFVCIALLLVTAYCSVRILTVPIIMKNMLTVINTIFIIVGCGIFAFGIYMIRHDDMDAGNKWIAYNFIAIGGIIFVLSMFGIIGARGKSRTLLMVYIIGVSACLLCLIASGICAFIFTDELSHKYETLSVGEIACIANLKGCTNCTNVNPDVCIGAFENNGTWSSCNPVAPELTCLRNMTVIHKDKKDQGFFSSDIAPCGQCPEWTASDVKSYVQTSLQFLGLVAVLICLFLLVGLVGAVILRKSLAGYQTDSI